MRTPLHFYTLLTFSVTACSFNSLPPRMNAVEPVRYSTLEVPGNLEVLSVDYDAVAYGGGDSKLTARSFLKVYGRGRSGSLYLLIYERGTGCRDPIDVIKIQSVETDSIVPPPPETR